MFLVYRYGSYYEALLRSQYNQLYLKNQVRECMIRIICVAICTIRTK